MMVLMSNEKHGLMHCYSPAEVESNKKNGWVVVEIEKEVISVPSVDRRKCPKCGEVFEKGMAMHVKWCKA